MGCAEREREGAGRGLITTSYNTGRIQKGNQYLNHVIVDGLVCNAVSCNMLIDCFCKAKMVEKAMEIFQEMQKKVFFLTLYLSILKLVVILRLERSTSHVNF